MSAMLLRAQKLPLFALLSALTTICSSQQMPSNQPPIWSTKPDVAAFEKMENDRLAAAQRAIDEMVGVKGKRTVKNTLVPYDEAIRQLNAANYFSQLMQQVHPETTFRDHATAMTTKVSSAQTGLSLNQAVYKALAALDLSQADAATRYYVQRQMLEFRQAGVDKDDATRKRLKELNDKLTEDLSMFDRNISDGKISVEVTNVAELDGLPQDYIDKHKPDANGIIHITTDYPDLFPGLTYARSDDLRRRLYFAYATRGYPKNRDVLLDMMQKRYEIATLLGYSSWADYSAADN
jgi:thimet oligopeptidase